MKDDLHGWLTKAAGRVPQSGRSSDVQLKDKVMSKDQDQHRGTWREPYWFRALHDGGSLRTGQRPGTRREGENKVGHAEPAERRSGLLPVHRLVHLSSFFFAQFWDWALSASLTICDLKTKPEVADMPRAFPFFSWAPKQWHLLLTETCCSLEIQALKEQYQNLFETNHMLGIIRIFLENETLIYCRFQLWNLAHSSRQPPIESVSSCRFSTF